MLFMLKKFGLGSRLLETQLLLLFAFVTAILGWIGWTTYSNNQQYRQIEARVNFINEQLRSLNRSMMALQDVETGQRGYLLTGKPEYLEPYEDASRGVHRELALTAKLFADEPALPHIHRLEQLKDAKLQELADTIHLYRSGRPDEAFAVVNTDAGRTLMDEVRLIVSRLQQNKRTEIAAIQNQSRSQYDDFVRSLAVLLCAIVTFLVIAYIALFQDLTERRRLKDQVREAQHADPLTGLANFLYLNSMLANILKHAYRDQSRVAALVIDLDNFHAVNDEYGFENGDRVLKTAANRLRDMGRRNDVIARISGDTFAVIMPHLHDLSEVRILADRIVHALTPALLPDMSARYLGASIGIALYPDDAVDRQRLLLHAQEAVRRAKKEGKHRYRFYSEETQARLMQDIPLIHELHRAVEREEFFLWYQPQIDMRSGCTVGVEALLRWRHPERGIVLPDAFAPLAEQSGLILPIGAWVLQEACRQAAVWNSQGHRWRVAVNVSSAELMAEEYPAILSGALRSSGLDPSLLDLEITERALLDQSAAATLHGLRQLGVQLSLDDFGTGYSSLSYLVQFPVHALKIDKSFTSGIPHDRVNLALVKAIVQMAHALDIDVIAEGVENLQQVQALLATQCRYAQGHHFFHPMAPDALAAHLTKSRSS